MRSVFKNNLRLFSIFIIICVLPSLFFIERRDLPIQNLFEKNNSSPFSQDEAIHSYSSISPEPIFHWRDNAERVFKKLTFIYLINVFVFLLFTTINFSPILFSFCLMDKSYAFLLKAVLKSRAHPPTTI
jgi:hypothetical protein